MGIALFDVTLCSLSFKKIFAKNVQPKPNILPKACCCAVKAAIRVAVVASEAFARDEVATPFNGFTDGLLTAAARLCCCC